MFCPKCGSKDVVDIFCAACLREQQPLVKGFKEFLVEACISCQAVHHRFRWDNTDDVGATLAEYLKEHLVFADYAIIEEVEVEPLHVELKSGFLTVDQAHVAVHGKSSKKAKTYVEEYDFPYKVMATVCRKCAKKGTQYFEGTLQVRNDTPESIAFLKEWLRQEEVHIGKEEKEKHGHDYYLGTKHAIEKAARALQERFGGRIQSSARLFSKSKMTSKEIYRATWFIELPFFKVGDAVRHDESPLFVMDLGKRIRFFNPARGKTEYHEYKEGKWERLPLFETRVSTVTPDLRVLHPETFEEVKVFNAKLRAREYMIDEKVEVCVDEKRVYIFEKKDPEQYLLTHDKSAK